MDQFNRFDDRDPFSSPPELIAAGGFGQSRERGFRGVYSRVETDFQALKEQYRFVSNTVD
jgi:hypothetical protein